VLVSQIQDSGEIKKRFREDSLPNSLLNPDDSDYEEKYEDVVYPPEEWPVTKDFQLDKAVNILKSSRYKTLLAEQSSRYKIP